MNKRHLGARTLAQVMEQSPTLLQLSERLNASKQCLNAVQALIPVAMRKAVHGGPLECITTQPSDNSAYYWVLLAENPAVAAKLRQLTPLMLQKFQETSLPVQEIRVQIISRPG